MLRKKIEVGVCNVQVWYPDTAVPDPPLPQLSFTPILADVMALPSLSAPFRQIQPCPERCGRRCKETVQSFQLQFPLLWCNLLSYSIFGQISLLQFQLVWEPKSLGPDDTASPFYLSQSSSDSDFLAVANLQINSSSWLAFQSFVTFITSCLLFGRNILNSFSFLRGTLDNAGTLIIDIYSAFFL